MTPTSHEYDWRCAGCKALYDDRPEVCERCGGTEFHQFVEE